MVTQLGVTQLGHHAMSDLAVPDADGIETRIARDLARHGLIAAPIVIIGAGIWRGPEAALAVGLALGLVILNFLMSAALLGWAARISPDMLMGVALGGFLIKVIVLFVVGTVVEQFDFVDFPVFVVTLLVAHLGLLAWETRSVSLSLASPGLKPRHK
jgi:hypothetical protein